MECGSFNFTVRLEDSAPVPNTDIRAYTLDVLCCNDYEISGKVSTLEGVLMILSGDASGTTITDEQGNYKLEHLTNGNYTITPSQDGAWFEPASRDVTVNDRDVSGIDFVGHIKGDFDGDNDVDGSDLAVFAADFGRTDCDSGPLCEGDFDGDGDLDGTDLAVFAANFGRTN